VRPLTRGVAVLNYGQSKWNTGVAVLKCGQSSWNAG